MKVLVIRFSSIGDIVLTTPVLRALKEQIPSIQLHFLTKAKFASLIKDNPRVDRLWTIEKSIKEVLSELKKENFDQIIDLHHNVRTIALKQKLGKPAHSFQKLNIQKWMLVHLKQNRLPDLHIVNRYLDTVKTLGVKPDLLPGEFYISVENEISAEQYDLNAKQYVGVAIGAQFATKTLPIHKLIEILDQIALPIVLLGGPDDQEKANSILTGLPHKDIRNLCGQLNLQQSASLVKQAAVLVTHDTGLMHIASCFETPVVSIWGNTVPAFGMYPYFPRNQALYSIHEVLDLSCRPCSKIGFQTCPKKHFKCMENQDVTQIVKQIQVFLKN